MRSIDADALNARIDKCVGIDGLGLEPVMAIRDIKALISVMPTIDAIPVAWLVNLKNEYAREGREQAEGDLMNLLLMWQKEQDGERMDNYAGD